VVLGQCSALARNSELVGMGKVIRAHMMFCCFCCESWQYLGSVLVQSIGQQQRTGVRWRSCFTQQPWAACSSRFACTLFLRLLQCLNQPTVQSSAMFDLLTLRTLLLLLLPGNLPAGAACWARPSWRVCAAVAA
jgi:hypothetical protein